MIRFARTNDNIRYYQFAYWFDARPVQQVATVTGLQGVVLAHQVKALPATAHYLGLRECGVIRVHDTVESLVPTGVSTPHHGWSWQFEQLAVGFDRKPVVTGLECTINRGDFVVISGANGTGKSCLCVPWPASCQLLQVIFISCGFGYHQLRLSHKRRISS